MFYARVAGKFSVLYTGDYNMTPDRHLGSATIDHKIRPDLLITETTCVRFSIQLTQQICNNYQRF